MANDNCSLKNTHPVTGLDKPSNLHRELLQRFPKDISGGDSIYYIEVRQSSEFLEFFGDWTDADTHAKLLAESINTNVFNDQNEPYLHTDLMGNNYFLNTKGETYYPKGVIKTLISQELNSLVNTLSSELILTPGEEIKDFILRNITGRIDELEESILDMDEEILQLEDKEDAGTITKEELERSDDLRDAVNRLMSSQIKLQNIKDQDGIINMLTKRVNDRLSTYKYKYVEIAKEDDPGSDLEDEIKLFTLESNQISNRAIDDVDVVRFLSTIPKFKEFNEDASLQEAELDELLLTPKYHNKAAVWAMLEGVLVDTVPNNVTEGIRSKDIFDNFITKLKEEVANTEHPTLNYILDFFETLEDENLKTKLVTAFNKAKQSFTITRVLKDSDDNLVYEIVNPADTSSKTGRIATEFVENIVVNPRITSDVLSDIVRKLTNDYKDLRKRKDVAGTKKLLRQVLRNDLGLKIPVVAIDYLVNSFTANGFEPLNKLISNFIKKPIHDSKTSSKFDGEIEALMELREAKKPKEATALSEFLVKRSSFIKAISLAAGKFREDVAEGSLLVGGSARWEYSLMPSMMLEILKWKGGDTSSLKALKERNLGIVEYLTDINPFALQDINVFIGSEIKGENDPSPVLMKDAGELDSHMDSLIKMFNSRSDFSTALASGKQGEDKTATKDTVERSNYITFNFAADKNSLYSIFGLPSPIAGKPDLYDSKNKKIGSDFKKVLKGYIKGELQKAANESTIALRYFSAENKKAYLMENLIPNFHFKTTKDYEVEDLTPEDFEAGSYYTLGVFSKSFFKYLKKNRRFVLQDSAPIPFFKTGFINHDAEGLNELMEIVYNDVNEVIKSDYKYLSQMKAVVREKESDDSKGGKDTVDYEVKNLFDVETNIMFADSNQKAYSYIIGSFINAYELSNIFNGHVSFYKQKKNFDIRLDDFLKRAPAVNSDGKYLRHRNTGESKTYTTYSGEIKTISEKDDATVVAIVNDIRWTDKNGKFQAPESAHINILRQALGDNKLTFQHELADAQGYVTPEHFRDVIERIYGFTENDEKIFDRLNDKDHRYNDEDIRWIKKFSKAYTPIKLVYFGVDAKGMPVYLKYSVAPLFPAMVNGTEAGTILKMMDNQGVEQLVFKSGSKASENAPTTIHKMNGEFFNGVNTEARLNPFLIDSTKLKIQTEIPTKLDGSVRLGNQSIKNIMTNLDLNDPARVFNVGTDSKPVMVSAQELYDDINNTAVSLLDTQLNSVLKRFGYESATGKFRTRAIKKLLINQMDLETEADLIGFLNSDLPLESIPNFGQRVFPVLSAFVHKNAGKIYTKGGSVVQVANMGFDRLTHEEASDVFFFRDEKLAPPLPKLDKDGNILYFDEDGKVTTKENGQMRINKAKILLPFASVFQETGLSYNEFAEAYKEGKISPEIFQNIIGYRIPNQSMSSNDSFEIIGILPPIAGDQAVVYHEITAKTGSDFDIDKMYLMMPNFEVKMKDWVIPDELKWKYGRDVPHIWDMLGNRFKDGNDLLRFLTKDNKVFDEVYKILTEQTGKAPKLKGKRFSVDNPLKLIFKNNEKIRDILQETGTVDDEGVPLVDTLDDLMNAYKKQRVLGQEHDKKVYDELGENEIEEVVLIEGDTFRGKQNRLIKLLSSILESGSSYNDLMSPLDNPIVKDTITKVEYEKAKAKEEIDEDMTLEEFVESTAPSGLKQMFPVSLVKSRTDVLEAKSLIAIMANNMTDIAESQKVAFSAQAPLGLVYPDGSPVTSLANIYLIGKEGDPDFKISKLVSYFMNAAVDAAKDSYIISGNFNTYTANAAMMLIRQGIPVEDLFTILMNDTIVEYSRDKKASMAKVADIQPEIAESQLEEYASALIDELVTHNWDIFKVIPRDKFLSNDKEFQSKILGYWHLLQTAGKEFNDAVVVAKSDANGAGRTISEMLSITNRLERVQQGFMKNSMKKWFKNGLTEENRKFRPNLEGDKDAKFLGAMANNTLFLMEELTKTMFMETTPRVKELVNTMSAALGKPLPTTEASIKLIYNYLYPFLLYSTGHRLYNINSTREEYLLGQFPKELVKFRESLKDPVTGETGNLFLDELLITTVQKENIIKFPNFRNYSKESKLMLKEAFLDLMNRVETVPMTIDLGKGQTLDTRISIADGLVQHLYLLSGSKTTLDSFHDLIPANYYINNMHGKLVQEFIESLGDPSMEHLEIANTLTLMAKINYTNYKIVKKVRGKGTIFPKNEPVEDAVVLEKLETGVDVGPDGEILKTYYLPFALHNKSLYMLTKADSLGPVYTLIDTRDTKEVKKYTYYDVEQGLVITPLPYRSETLKLFGDRIPEVDDNTLEDC